MLPSLKCFGAIFISVSMALGGLPTWASEARTKSERISGARAEKVLNFHETFLTFQQFKSLSADDQVIYLSYMNTMFAVLQASLDSESVVILPKGKTSLLELMMTPEQAQAWVGLVPGAAVAIGRGVAALGPRALSALKWFPRAGSETIRSFAQSPITWGQASTVAGIYQGTQLAASGAQAIQNWAQDMSQAQGSSIVARAALPETGSGSSPRSGQVVGRAVAEQQEIRADYRKEGAVCIFGGFASNYQIRGGRPFCVTPSEKLNSPACRSNPRPSFECQNFGLHQSSDQPRAVCVKVNDGEGLVDLTERCMSALSTQIKDMVAISPESYNRVRQTMVEAFNRLMASKGIDDSVSLESYCANNNSLNQSRQARECRALLDLKDYLVKVSPEVVSTATQARNAERAAAGPRRAGGSNQPMARPDPGDRRAEPLQAVPVIPVESAPLPAPEAAR